MIEMLMKHEKTFFIIFLTLLTRSMSVLTMSLLTTVIPIHLNSLFHLKGLPYELTNVWQQYPWIFGEPLCKVRALISEM
jgi:hypothetical protein